MTPVERALRARLEAGGPIPVDAYMAACNDHYYATRDPLGAAGDFTTAPEIHQMFGEMIGAALADWWDRVGRPPVAYAELGPGRGTLAADALRVLKAAGCTPAAIHLVETSPRLRAIQAARLPGARHHDGLAALDDAADTSLLVVANEFFDALPICQSVGGAGRHVVLDGDRLAFDRSGETVETSPARAAAMEQLAALLARVGGAAIVVDYGHDRPDARGDTLQAVRGHAPVAVLDRPGEQDLTAHVDFAALAAAARAGGAIASRVASQGSWLETLGIAARAMALAARNPAHGAAVAAARRRLCAEEEMGTLFKVMAVTAPGAPGIAGLER